MSRHSPHTDALTEVVRGLAEPFDYKDAWAALHRRGDYRLQESAANVMKVLVGWRMRGRLSADTIGRAGAPTRYRRTEFFDAPAAAPRPKRRGYRGPRQISPFEQRWRDFKGACGF